ncbi:MAG: glycosyltransferase [Planctomycetota bacterium]
MSTLPATTVAMLASSLGRSGGGVSEALRGLATAISEQPDVAVHVLSLGDPPDESWAPIPTATFTPGWPRQFGRSPQMLRALVQCDPDVAHAHGIWMYPSFAARRWHRLTGRPYLISPHGMLEPWALRHKRIRKLVSGLLVENVNLRKAACLHALNEAELDSIRAAGLRNPVCVIPNGVTRPAEDASVGGGTSLPPWHERYGQGTRVLLFLGRLHPKKGLNELLDAWAMASARHSGWALVIVGWGDEDYAKNLQRLVHHRAIADSVMFAGPRFGAEKQAALACASGFILPSHSEGQPMAILEAWSYGLPVMMTAECNLPEGFDADAALRVVAEPIALADGLNKLTRLDDARRRLLGENGRALVRRRFEWRHIGAGMTAVYRWLVGAGARPDCVHLV